MLEKRDKSDQALQEFLTKKWKAKFLKLYENMDEKKVKGSLNTLMKRKELFQDIIKEYI